MEQLEKNYSGKGGQDNLINYNELLKAEIEGLYGDQLEKVNKILEWYKIYDGDQEWQLTQI